MSPGFWKALSNSASFAAVLARLFVCRLQQRVQYRVCVCVCVSLCVCVCDVCVCVCVCVCCEKMAVIMSFAGARSSLFLCKSSDQTVANYGFQAPFHFLPHFSSRRRARTWCIMSCCGSASEQACIAIQQLIS